MQSAIENNIIVLKLSNDSNLIESITSIAIKHEITAGIILNGIGMLKNFELGYFDPNGYKTTTFKNPHELVSMSGSLAYDQNDSTNFLPHIHCVVADEKHMAIGGHLLKAQVNVINEITILKLQNVKLNRVKNESNGLMELQIYQ